MLRVDHHCWGQTGADLRRLALTAPHGRTRERFLALHDMAQGACATQVAERTGRHPQTVMEWLHLYNERGPDALAYQRTGGRPPFAQGSKPSLAPRSAPRNSRQPARPQPGPTRRRAGR